MLRLVSLLVVVLQGTVSLKVSGRHLVDVSVDTRLYPQNPVLRVGSGLNFTIEGLNDQVSGRWFSGNKSILSICMSSGRAAAVGQGTTQVLFDSSSVKLQTIVRVVMEDIFVDAPKEMLTNAPFPGREYKFSVKLRMSNAFLGNYTGVPFDCKVEPRYVGYAVPWKEHDTGNFYCLFLPYSPELLMRLAPRLKDMMPVKSVSIIASLTEANQVSGCASARFIGGFSILGRNGQETNMLSLSPDSNTTSITLVGNTDVQVHVNKNKWASIKVRPISKEDWGIGGYVVYEVKVLELMSSSGQFIIMLPANGQRVKIDVIYNSRVEFPTRVMVPLLILMFVLLFCVSYQCKMG